MRIIPVLDVLNGVVVRAVGGRRAEYRPVLSRLTASTEPRAVAEALLSLTGAEDLYLADLDGIARHPSLSPNGKVIRRVTKLPARVWVDGGIRTKFDEESLLRFGVTHFVIGTESADGTYPLVHLATMYDPATVALSIDLRNGELIGNGTKWGRTPDDAIGWMTECAQGMGLARLIVLDLGVVGTASGPQTLDVCRRVKEIHPAAEVWTGGGVRDWDDVKRLEDAGVDGVLVASALHDGTLTFPRP